ncbi:MAG: class I SAM-dependent methyltransferase [Fibrobacterota bacterium]
MAHSTDVCGVEHAKWLDNGVRRLIHNPQRLFGPYVKRGGTAIDIGCGPGTFTLGLAKMVGSDGKVIAVDLQRDMLDMTRTKVESAGFGDRVDFHQCKEDEIGLDVKADFILTFYMVHETPDPIAFIDQVSALLAVGGFYYLSEPKFHVSKRQFDEVLAQCRLRGLSVVKTSGFLSRTAILQKTEV